MVERWVQNAESAVVEVVGALQERGRVHAEHIVYDVAVVEVVVAVVDR